MHDSDILVRAKGHYSNPSRHPSVVEAVGQIKIR